MKKEPSGECPGCYWCADESNSRFKTSSMGKSSLSALLVQFSPFSPSSLLCLLSFPSLVLAQCSDKHKNRLKDLSRHSMLGFSSLQILTLHSTEHGRHPITLKTKGRETWREVGAHKWNCSVHSLGFMWRTFHHPAQWARERAVGFTLRSLAPQLSMLRCSLSQYWLA